MPRSKSIACMDSVFYSAEMASDAMKKGKPLESAMNF